MAIRIVVIEDDPDDRELFVNVLEAQGYAVLAPDSLDELLHMLGTTNPHCVVCDQCLDGDAWGVSGLELVEALGEMLPWVLMTKQPLDMRDMAKVWQPNNGRNSKVQGFYNKLDPMSRLIENIDNIIRAHLPINESLTILPTDTAAILTLVAPQLVGAAAGSQIEQFRDNLGDLLRMLFHTYTAIQIKRKLYGGDGMCLLHIGAEPANGPTDNLLLLCGAKHPVCAVLDAYNQHGPTNGALYRRDMRERIDTAGAIFGFAGDLGQVRSLSEIWLSRPPSQVNEVLDRFVAQHLAAWHTDGNEQLDGPDALARGLAQLQLTPDQLDRDLDEERIQALCSTAPRSLRAIYVAAERRIELTGWDGKLHAYPNPVDALAQFERIGAGWSASFGAIYGVAHPAQILVEEQNRQIVLWNYCAAATSGLRLMDFALLERNLRFDVLKERSPIEHYELELALLAAEDDLPGPSLSPALQLVCETLLTFRRKIVGMAGLADLRPYYALLLLGILQSLRPHSASGRAAESEIAALLVAAVLAQRLLAHASMSATGLVIDPKTAEVIINGVYIERERGSIIPQDRKFLLYLYKRHDQLCTYEEIICDFYRTSSRATWQQMMPVDQDKLLKQERPRIDATLNRLRTIIEPEAATSDDSASRKTYRYLITRRGSGVVLKLQP